MLQSQRAERGREKERGQSARLQKQLWSPAVSPHLCHIRALWLWVSGCLCGSAHSSIKMYRQCGEVQVWGWKLIAQHKLLVAEVTDVIMESYTQTLWRHFSLNRVWNCETLTLAFWQKTSALRFQWLLFLKMKRICRSLAKHPAPLGIQQLDIPGLCLDGPSVEIVGFSLDCMYM